MPPTVGTSDAVMAIRSVCDCAADPNKPSSSAALASVRTCFITNICDPLFSSPPASSRLAQIFSVRDNAGGCLGANATHETALAECDVRRVFLVATVDGEVAA